MGIWHHLSIECRRLGHSVNNVCFNALLCERRPSDASSLYVCRFNLIELWTNTHAAQSTISKQRLRSAHEDEPTMDRLLLSAHSRFGLASQLASSATTFSTLARSQCQRWTDAVNGKSNTMSQRPARHMCNEHHGLTPHSSAYAMCVCIALNSI